MYNILICDDEQDIVNAVKIYLTPEGYRLLEAQNDTLHLHIDGDLFKVTLFFTAE